MDFIAQHSRRLQAGIGGVVVSGLNTDANLVHQVIADLRIEVGAGINSEAPRRRIGNVAEAIQLDQVIAANTRIHSRKDTGSGQIAQHHILHRDTAAAGEHARRRIGIATVQIERIATHRGIQTGIVAIDDQAIERYAIRGYCDDRAAAERVEREAGIDHRRNQNGFGQVADVSSARINAGLRTLDRHRFVDDQILARAAVLGITAGGDMDGVVRVGLRHSVGDGLARRCLQVARAAVGAAGGDIPIEIETGLDATAGRRHDTQIINVDTVRAIRDRVGSVRLLPAGIGIARDAKAGVIARDGRAWRVAVTTVEIRSFP